MLRRLYVFLVRHVAGFSGWRATRWLGKAKRLAEHATRVEGGSS